MNSTSPSLTPISVGGRTFKNRIVVTSHTYGLLDGTTSGTDAMAAYVKERLVGGVAALILGETSVDGGGVGWGAASAGDNLVKFYRTISGMAVEHGAQIIEQLYAPGGQTWHEEQRRALAPSSVPHTRSYVIPAKMTVDDIEKSIASFVYATTAVAKGGLSGVEIKADQGKLVHQFLARRFNLREDRWGGEGLAGRARFLLEILRGIRQCQPQLLLGVRLPLILDHSELQMGNLPVSELVSLVKLIDAEGLVDYISLTAESNSTARGYWIGHPDMQVNMNAYQDAARQIREVARVPTLHAGGALDLQRSDEIIRRGSADLVGMTRASIADPHLVRKHLELQSSAIRPCIACNDGCVGNTWVGRPIRCSVNPQAGRETTSRRVEMSTSSHSSPPPVAIIGAGPAGLQCALTLSEHGVRSELFEKRGRTGGQMLFAAELPGNERFSEYLKWMDQALSKTDLVTVRLNTVASIGTLERMGTREIVLACGSEPMIPEQFTKNSSCITDLEALSGDRAWDGRRVVLVDSERTRDALGVAEWLAIRGAVVEVITPFDTEGIGLNPAVLVPRLAALGNWSVVVSRWSEVVRVDDHMVHIFNQISGDVSVRSGIDAVVFVCNGLPSLAETHSDTWLVGNAKLEGKLEDAVRSGDDAAREILNARERIR